MLSAPRLPPFNLTNSQTARIATRTQAKSLEPERIVLVVGHGADQVRERVTAEENDPRIAFVVQEPRKGTGHAVLCALPEIGEKVALAVATYRRQFRITATRPSAATGAVGKVNVGLKPPLATAGLSFDGPVR